MWNLAKLRYALMVKFFFRPHYFTPFFPFKCLRTNKTMYLEFLYVGVGIQSDPMSVLELGIWFDVAFISKNSARLSLPLEFEFKLQLSDSHLNSGF